MHDRERFVKLTRLDEQGNDKGDVWINDDHVVAVLGPETETAVRVLTVAGEIRVAQPQGEGEVSVLARLRGTAPAAPKAKS